MAFLNESVGDGKWRTIDRNGNIILQMVGEMLREPFVFNFNIDGEIVGFEAHQNIRQLESTYEIQWRIVKITVPPHFKLDRSQLHALIEEALDAYGFSASRKIIDRVSVIFAPDSSTT